MSVNDLFAAARGRAESLPKVDWERAIADPPYLEQYERVLAVLGDDLRELAWGTMVYACDRCGFERRVWLGVGVEGPPALRDLQATIPCPMVAGSCPKCDGHLSHVRWSEDEEWDEPRPFDDGVARFIVPDTEKARALAGRNYGGADYAGEPEREPQPGDDELSIRCTICAREFTKGEAAKIRGRCPRCGTTSLPMSVADDVEVNVNWHELRILGMWAELWASAHKDKDPSMQRLVSVICGRLHAQHPDKTSLTMTGELDDVRRAGFDITDVQGFSEDAETKPPEEGAA